jgi:hypothetical protein
MNTNTNNTLPCFGGPRDGDEIICVNSRGEVITKSYVDGNLERHYELLGDGYYWVPTLLRLDIPVPPKPRADWNAIMNNPPDIGPTPRSRRKGPWISLAIALGAIITVAALNTRPRHDDPPVKSNAPVEALSAPEPTPAPTHLSLSSDNNTVILTASEPTPVEVRRAEPAPTPTFRLAHMPDGSSLAVRILGAFTRQEELPLTGNVVGDVYYVGRFPFVWTQLNNGMGAWIDPQIK